MRSHESQGIVSIIVLYKIYINLHLRVIRKLSDQHRKKKKNSTSIKLCLDSLEHQVEMVKSQLPLQLLWGQPSWHLHLTLGSGWSCPQSVFWATHVGIIWSFSLESSSASSASSSSSSSSSSIFNWIINPQFNHPFLIQSYHISSFI